MTGRYVEVPFHRLFAEIAAAPLCTEEAFEHVVLDLVADVTSKRQGSFWEAIEGKLIREFPAVSVDEFTSLRDYVWLGSTQERWQNRKIFLESYLGTLAKAILDDSGHQLVPKVNAATVLSELSGGSSERFGRECFSWLQRSMPPDLLRKSFQPHAALAPVNRSVLRLLEQNYAETHLHLGASLTFTQLWPCIVSSIDDSGFKFDALGSRNGAFDHGRGMATWLIRAAIARILLGEYLVRGNKEGSFENFVVSRRTLYPADSNPSFVMDVIQCLANPIAVRRQYTAEEFRFLQRVYRRMIWPIDTKVGDLPSLRAADPLTPILNDSAQTTETAEDRLIEASLRYMQSRNGRQDTFFRTVFWQVQRIRCLAYRHVTQQHGVPGLVWFTRFYRRISPTRRGKLLTSGKVCAAAFTAGVGRGLQSLEVRVAPESSSSDVMAEVQELCKVSQAINEVVDTAGASAAEELVRAPLARSIANLRAPKVSATRDELGRVIGVPVKFELGLVLHFVKERERGKNVWGGRTSQDFLSAFGQLSHENPSLAFKNRYRYRDYFVRCRKQSDAICRVLREYPLTLQWIRGIDICNDELAMPTWLFAPLFSEIVETSKETSAYLHSEFGLEVPPIRATAHVGEDFVHLLTGLRRIDEAVEQLAIGEGSRIGHALALGTDPRDWASGVGPLAMDKLTRLHDLVWEWSIMNELSEIPSFPRAHFVQTHAQRIIDELFSHWESLDETRFCRKPTMHDLVTLRRNLCDPSMLAAVGFPDETPGLQQPTPQLNPLGRAERKLGSTEQRNNELKILKQYLTDPVLFRRGRDVMLVKTSQTGETIAAVQDGLRCKVAARGILVEVNPSSNQVVGGVGDLRNHPIWRISRPEYSGDIPEVAICVGSDDPLVFATDLPQEYQRLADVLLKQGYSQHSTMNWLDSVRRNSLSARVTLPFVSHASVDSVYRPTARPTTSQH